MAAYAALVSVMHIIDQIQLHPRPPISLDQKQVESLTEKVNFLQKFLEEYSLHVGYMSVEADGLESRIADVAYAAEDVIESHIVDRIIPADAIESHIVDRIIPAASTSHGNKKIKYSNCFGGNEKATSRHGKKIITSKPTTHGEEIRSIDFYQDLQKVIEGMDLIKKEVMEIQVKMGGQDQPQRDSSIYATSLGSASIGQKSTMVGFDDVLLEILDKLIGGQSHRQIIPIVGMGGIGKTTLAKNISENQLVVHHFDILIWVTISQEYRMREILLHLLQKGGENLSQLDVCELGDKLHKKLWGRRYLIIMDDIWDDKVWDQLNFYFPDNNNESRIMITTRLSYLASQLADSHGRIDMDFLGEVKSWNLFSRTVFGEVGCPLELEEIGKKIVKNCQGLPLSIVVIGGLLAKFKHTKKYWEYIAENLNSVVNSEDDERCLKILQMSYNQLPVYLKPCFLHMGVFSEDHVIRVSSLVKLWVAEGFLKPSGGKRLEIAAKEYLKDLIDRNLILVSKLGSTESIKYCSIHDLLRDLCLREAQKERFYNVLRQQSLNVAQDISTQRRIVFPKSTSKEEALDALQPMPLARSLAWDIDAAVPLLNFRLLRTLKTSCLHYRDRYFLKNTFQLVNSRYLAIKIGSDSKFPSSICLLWNLETLIVRLYDEEIIAPAEIWSMPLLRHLDFNGELHLAGGLHLPDPPRDDIVLGNLQTLKGIMNFNCGEEVVNRIPNIKKLGIHYKGLVGNSCTYHVNNLERLHKLENFNCRVYFSEADILPDLTFPYSLKKLALQSPHVNWEDMLGKIGSLPHLEKLKLTQGTFKGRKWETVEGEFRSLKFLKICGRMDLEYWTTERSHFPRLEHLILRGLEELKEIPSEIGEIPTLKLIELDNCSGSAVVSAKKIVEEQEDFQGDELTFQVRVSHPGWGENKALGSLASRNFHVELYDKS